MTRVLLFLIKILVFMLQYRNNVLKEITRLLLFGWLHVTTRVTVYL